MTCFFFLFSLFFTKPETESTWKILWRVGCNSQKNMDGCLLEILLAWLGKSRLKWSKWWNLTLQDLFDHFVGQIKILFFLFFFFSFAFFFWIRLCCIVISKLGLMKFMLALSSCLGWLWKSVCFGEMVPGQTLQYAEIPSSSSTYYCQR